MGLHVHIPARENGSFFTLFARGKVENNITVAEAGTFIELEGVAALFYKYPHCRRAYLVRNTEELHNYRAVRLPNVKERVGIVFRARGRQIDLLRKALYFLKEMNGVAVFTKDTVFWQKVVCLIEMCKGRYSGRLKYNLAVLSACFRQS